MGRDLSPLVFDATAGEERSLYFESLYATKFDCAGLRGLRRGRWKYLWSVEPELYDLQADPGELHSLYGERADVASALHAELEQLLERHAPPEPGGGEPGDAEGLARVQALGYAGGLVDTSLELDPDALDPKAFLPDYLRYLDVYGLIDAKRLDEAAAICDALLATHTDLLAVRELLGRVRAQQGRHEEAVGIFEDYVQRANRRRGEAVPIGEHALDPAIGLVLIELGNSQRALERWAAAVQSYELAAEALPDSPDPWVSIGNLMGQDLRRYRKAIEAYERGLELHPDYVAAHNNLANCYLAQGDPERAAEHYRAALAVDPDQRAAREGLRRALERMDP